MVDGNDALRRRLSDRFGYNARTPMINNDHETFKCISLGETFVHIGGPQAIPPTTLMRV